MLPRPPNPQVLVTGAVGFLGFRVVTALLELEIPVTILIHPDQDDKVATLAGRVKIVHGDVWNRASLKGLLRGYQTVVHLVGSRQADPKRGLTYQQINLVAARNVIGMAISDGVLNVVLLSVAALPFSLPDEYIRSKREAEDYLQHSGLNDIILRPPLLYYPSSRTFLLTLLSGLRFLPLLGRYMPLSVHTAARGIASIVENPEPVSGRILYARHLRRFARRHQPRTTIRLRPVVVQPRTEEDFLDETPFGWLPSAPARRR